MDTLKTRCKWIVGRFYRYFLNVSLECLFWIYTEHKDGPAENKVYMDCRSLLQVFFGYLF